MQLGSIILAAGRGKRMNVQDTNKVVLTLASKPIVLHIVEFMHRLVIKTIVVVVGHARESVEETLKDQHVIFVEQTEQLGTGHAVQIALSVLPKEISDVFVVYGDDAVFYTEKNRPIMEKLFETHKRNNPSVTFLTIEQENPAGLGRIIRDSNDNVTAIVEEKDATEEQKKINEINPGCFVFSVEFLKKYLPQVKKNPITGEYYLTDLIHLAIEYEEKLQAVRGGAIPWRGVNTKEELEEAEKLFQEFHRR